MISFATTLSGVLRQAGRLVLVAALASLLLGPAQSAASDPAVDMYAEFIPDEKGGKPTKKVDFGDKKSKLPTAARKDLNRLGADGREVDRLVALAGAGPDGGSSAGSANGTGRSERPAGGDDGTSQSTLGVIGSGLGGGDGLGFVLPVALLLIGGLVLLVVVLRQRIADQSQS